MKFRNVILISFVFVMSTTLSSCSFNDQDRLTQTGKYYELSDLKIRVLFPEKPAERKYGSPQFQVVDYICVPTVVYDRNFKYSFGIIKSDLSVLSENIENLDVNEKLNLIVDALYTFKKENPNVQKLETRSGRIKGRKAKITKMVAYNPAIDAYDYYHIIIFPYKEFFIRIEVITDIKDKNNRNLKDFIRSVEL